MEKVVILLRGKNVKAEGRKDCGMKIIGKIAKIEWVNILMIAIVMAVSYVIGVGIGFVRMKMEHEIPYYIPIGVGITMVMIMIVQVIITVFTFAKSFNLAVSMGITRHEFLVGYQLFNLAELIILTVSFWVLYRLEGFFAGICFPEEPMIENMNYLFQIRMILPALLGLCCLEFFIEAVTMRFGTKAWWTLWAIWMALCLGVPKLIERGVKGILPEELQKVGSMFVTGGPVLWSVCGVAVLVILVLVAWRMLVKQQVTA